MSLRLQCCKVVSVNLSKAFYVQLKIRSRKNPPFVLPCPAGGQNCQSVTTTTSSPLSLPHTLSLPRYLVLLAVKAGNLVPGHNHNLGGRESQIPNRKSLITLHCRVGN